MSYIRCLSNPEGLYIYEDGKFMWVWIGTDHTRKMPRGILTGLIHKFRRQYASGEFSLDPNETLSYKNASICNVKRGKNFKVRLAYEEGGTKWECFMWEVTWMFIVTQNQYRA